MVLNDEEFKMLKSANEKAKTIAQQGLACSVTILWNRAGMEKILVNSEFFTTSQNKPVDANPK